MTQARTEATPAAAAERKPVNVPAPAAGTPVTVPAANSSAVHLQFDTADATFDRDGDNLVITGDNGAQTIVSDFFVTGGEQLPPMVLPDGTQVDTAAFLAQVNPDMDLATAAGPGAGRAPGSGGTNYDDATGELLGGVDKYGALGTDFWGRGSEVPEADLGLEQPGGTATLLIITTIDDPEGSLNGAHLALFEDGQPKQHELGDEAPLNAGKMELTFAGTGSTILETITINNIPEGSQIFLGDPNDGGVALTITSGSILNIPYANFTDPNLGLYIIAPEDSDDDFTLNLVLTITAQTSGISATVPFNYDVVVDAVADLPIEISFGAALDGQDFATLAAPSGNVDSEATYGETKTVTLQVGAQFSDHLDGSERQFFQLEGIPSGWINDDMVLPNNWVIVDFKDLPPLLAEKLGPDALIIEVTDAIPSDAGTATDFYLSDSIVFDIGDWTNSRLDGGDENALGKAEITLTPVTYDNPDGDPKNLEYTTSNNVSLGDEQSVTISLLEDIPEIITSFIKLQGDESIGNQTWSEKFADLGAHVENNTALLTVIAGLDNAPAGDPLSVASNGIAYNLFSDGTDDGVNGGSQRNGASFGFEGTNGTDSGWTTTAGEPISLFFEDGMVVGRIADGSIAFVVAVSGDLTGGAHTGTVSMFQYMSLHHDNTASHNEALQGLALNLVLRDDDGDKTQITVTVNVNDDGPKAGEVSVTVRVAETDLVAGSDAVHKHDDLDGHNQNHHHHLINSPCCPHVSHDDQTVFAGQLVASAFNFGADGPDSNMPFEWIAPEVTGIDGQPLVWENAYDSTTQTTTLIGKDSSGNDIIIVKAEGVLGGAPSYSVELKGPIMHENGNGHNEADLTFDFIIRDGDGDVAPAGSLTVNVVDDVPCAGHCTVVDAVCEEDMRGDGTSIASGILTADFNADGAHAENPIFWDQAAITEEASYYKAMIDGQAVSLDVIFSADGKTFTFTANGQEVATGVVAYDAETGKCFYNYEQSIALQHKDSWLNLDPADHVRKLDLTYVIQDADGDIAKNQLDIFVWDSVQHITLPDLGHVDETDIARGEADAIVLTNLDYATPDGIADVQWSKLSILALQKCDYVKSGTNVELTYEIDANNPHILYGKSGTETILTLTLKLNADGKWEVDYDQTHGISHPLGTFAHNDPIALPLAVTSFDGDGDPMLNSLTIVVTDDGPKSQFTSNIVMFEHLGDIFADGMNDMTGGTLFDLWHNPPQGADVEQLGKDLLAGTKDTAALADLVKLVINANLQDDIAAMLKAALGGGFIADAAEPLLIAGLNAALGGIDPSLSMDLTDTVRTPEDGTPDVGTLQVDYGFDGHATEHTHPALWDKLHGDAQPSPVGWSQTGIQGMLTLLGIRSSSNPNEPLVVEADEAFYPPKTLYVKAGDEVVMTLTIDSSNPDSPQYIIDQECGLFHNQDSLLNTLLTNLGESLGSEQMQDLTAGIITDLVNDAIANALGSLNLGPLNGMVTNLLQGLTSGLTGSLTDFVNGLLNPEGLIASLGPDGMLYLPLTYITMDGDGDITSNLVLHAVRDSDPYTNEEAYAILNEAKLEFGTGEGDFAAISSGVLAQFGFDGAHAETPFAWTKPSIELTTADDKPIVWELSADGQTLTGYVDDLDNAVIVIEATFNGNEINYIVTQHQAIEHEGQGTNPLDSLKLDYSIMDGDGDTASGTLPVKIYDDIAKAEGETDTLDYSAADHAWTATGNVLDNDKFGADGEAKDNSLEFADGRPSGNTITVQGKYGHLEVDAKTGEYTYHLTDAGKLAGDVRVDGTYDVALTANDVTAYSGVDINVNKISKWSDLSLTESTLSIANGKIGVDSPKVGLFDDNNNTIQHTGSYKEAVLLTMPEASDSITLHFNDLKNKTNGIGQYEEKVTLLLFDADGNCIGEPIVVKGAADGSVDYTCTSTGQNIASILVIADSSGSTLRPTDFTLSATVSTHLPEQMPKEYFEYTLTDGDGDKASATLVIDTDTCPQFLGADNLVVHEDGMANGTNAGKSDHSPSSESGFATIASPEQLEEITIGGVKISLSYNAAGEMTATFNNATETVANGDFTVESVSRTLVNGAYEYKVEYKYTVTERAEHSDNSQDLGRHELLDPAIKVGISATDMNGDTLPESSFTIQIRDDASIAHSDWVSALLDNGATVYGNVNTGVWSYKGDLSESVAAGLNAADNWGADGGKVTAVRIHNDAHNDLPDAEHDGEVWVALQNGTTSLVVTDAQGHTLGTLTMKEDGSYTFKAEAVEKTVTLFDSGEGYHASLDKSATAEVNGYSFSSVVVPNYQANSFGKPDSFALGDKFNIDGNTGGLGIKGGGANVHSNIKNEVNFEGDKNVTTQVEGIMITAPEGANPTEFHFSLAEMTGNEQVRWVAFDADGTVLGTGYSTAGASEVSINAGAPIGSVLLFPGNECTSFRISEITTTMTTMADVQDFCFDYQVTDGDGDVTLAQLHFHGAATLNLDTTTSNVIVDEANLNWGNDPVQNLLTKTGFIDIDHQKNDFELTIEHGNASITISKAELEAGNYGDKHLSEADGKGSFSITGYDASTGKITYTYTLHSDWEHKQPENNADLDSLFAVTVKDLASGAESKGAINVSILDDISIAADDVATSNGIGATVMGGVLDNDHSGADGYLYSNDAGVVHVWKGAEGSTTGSGYSVFENGDTVIDGSYGTLTIKSDGSYSYKQTTGAPQGTQEKFTYQISDADGDKDLATLSIDLKAPADPSQFIVGQNINDDTDSTSKWVVGDGAGTITGKTGDDILVGDSGGASFPPKDYNMLFVLDYSGSMNISSGVSRPGGGFYTREEVMEMGLNKMFAEISKYEGGDVNVGLLAFSTGLDGGKMFSFKASMNDAQRTAVLNDMKAALASTSFIQGGYTNYEAGLDTGAKWFKGELGEKPLANAENYTYFISDGEPNTYVDAKGENKQVGKIGDNYKAQDALDAAKADDTDGNGWKYLAANSTLRGIGIGTASSKMTYINQIDETGAGTNIEDMGSFEKVLFSMSPIQFAQAGSDYVAGDEGNDFVFGDVLNTDALAKELGLKELGRDMDPGQGWKVFAMLEGSPKLSGTLDFDGESYDLSKWNRETTIEFINNHHESLGVESSWTGQLQPGNPSSETTAVRGGGDDFLVGGHGSDIMYGQEGDDILIGGVLHYDGKDGDAAFAQLKSDTGIPNPSVEQLGKYLANHMDEMGQGTAADGNNVLNGGSGNDIIIGGGGNDLISGGAGDDIMFGGAGADTFAFSKFAGSGKDAIMDFSMKDGDKLSFDDLLSGDKNANLDAFIDKVTIQVGDLTQDNATVTLKLGGDEITINMGDKSNYEAFTNNWYNSDGDLSHGTEADMQAALLKELITLG